MTGPSPAEREAARLERIRTERESRPSSKPTYIVEDEDGEA